MKESENIDKYLDVVRELKELWKMQVTVIPIVFGTLEMLSKRLEKRLEELEIRERIKTIQAIVLLRSAKILIYCH